MSSETKELIDLRNAEYEKAAHDAKRRFWMWRRIEARLKAEREERARKRVQEERNDDAKDRD